MRGRYLDKFIEYKLQLMLVERFDKSPISSKVLHFRLKEKGIVKGGLSTLSTSSCRSLIFAYVDQ
ncbi:hypothetical protein GCM10009131_22840 [Morganella psychrotolerans]